jgi:hypothetical protein
MTERQRVSIRSGLIVGLLVLAVGILLLLERLDLGIGVSLKVYWPALLIIVGIVKVFQDRDFFHLIMGVVLVVVGALFQANNLGIINFWFGDLWPLAIILAGVLIIRGSFMRPRMFSPDGSCCAGDAFENAKGKRFHHHGIFEKSMDSDVLQVSTVFGGGDYKISSTKFKGGSASCVFGSIDLDLRDAEMEGDSIVLDFSVMFGAIEMRVPGHWQITMHGTPFLASMENKTVVPKEKVKKVVINGSALFGAIEVKN